MTKSATAQQNQISRKTDSLIRIYRDLSASLGNLTFDNPVTHVYNPLEYARDPAEQYLRLASAGKNRVVLLGMNPGPWGMAQTGVPFGTANMVRDWLKIEGRVGKPQEENPKRPITGFDVKREEVSGTRFWGWARDRFSTPEKFFDQFFVANYCPLVFMEASGKNRTPDKLSRLEKDELFRICDDSLQRVVEVLGAELIVGIGKFAEDRARFALSHINIRYGRVLHPSPASPIANKGWSPRAESQLGNLGIHLPS